MRRLALVTPLLAAAVACDYTGDELFSNPTDVPGVLHLETITPIDVESLADIAPNVVYGEVGATGSSAIGGVTYSFVGTGGSVCLWVDPEAAAWNQSVGKLAPVEQWTYPDNPQDDGDLDLYAGLAVYYNGSPGEEVGNFEILYEDSLGNQVPVQLNECTIASGTAVTGGHAGRGMPEYCTLQATQPGVNYLVLMESWSTPLDDDRLSYGMFVANGDCRTLLGNVNVSDECVILGESIEHSCATIEEGTGKVTGTAGGCEDTSRPDSEEFELAWCGAANGETTLVDFCVTEAEEKDCSTERCFCGDPDKTPSGAATE